MSISDRLDQIEADIPLAARSPEMAQHFTADHGPQLLAAVRAALEACNEATVEARPHGGGERYMVVPIREVRRAIATALGEEQA